MKSAPLSLLAAFSTLPAQTSVTAELLRRDETNRLSPLVENAPAYSPWTAADRRALRSPWRSRSDMDAPLPTDLTAVKQIPFNLIDNARKYAPDSSSGVTPTPVGHPKIPRGGRAHSKPGVAPV